MSVGSKGVATDGIVFSLDSFNLKSYLLDTTQEIVVDTENYTPYYGFTPSTTLSLPGNLTSTWTQYIIDNNGSVPIHLYGGATAVTIGSDVNWIRLISTNYDVINSSNLKIARANNGWLYNKAVENAKGPQTPTGTLWSYLPVDIDLTTVKSLIYDYMQPAVLNAIGDFLSLPGTKWIMHDTINDNYYHITFNTWSSTGNGAVSYTRKLLSNIVSGTETYNVSSVIFTPGIGYLNPGETILHQHGTGSITITQSCVMNDTWYGGPLIVKVPGIDLSSLSVYASLNNNSLDLLLNGGISSTISTTASFVYYTDNCWPPPCGSIPTIPGYSNKVRNNINSQGGSMSVYLTGGTSETYIATGAFTNYDSFTGEPTTVLYGLGSTYSMYNSPCIISAPWGFNMIIYQNFDLTTFLKIYNNNNTSNIAFNLSGGAINEIYYADNVYFDGIDTYIYNSSSIGTQYTDHTNFDIYIRDLNQLSNTDNTIASYYDVVEPEIYTVQQFYFDGTDTYLFDDNGIGASYSGNIQFDAKVLSIIGTQYDNYTNFTYSHLTYSHAPPNVVTNLKTDSTVPVSFNLANGLASNKKEFLFDGIDDYIDIGNLGAFTSFTLDIWFNSSSHTNYRNIVDFNGNNSGIRIEQTLGYSGNWLNGGPGLATCGIVFNSSQYIGIGGDKTTGFYQDHWNNIIVRYDGVTKNGVFYLNGEKIVDFIGGIYNMRIGDGYDYSSRRFQGRIPYVALYNKSISESEALNNYNTLKWRFI